MTQNTTRTIDNLGADIYVSYEKGRRQLEQKYVSESRDVALQIQTDISEPFVITDFQLLFDLTPKAATWVYLSPPPNFKEQKRRLFTHQLAPKLGPEEYLEMQIERIEDALDQEEKKASKQPKKGLFAWEHDQQPNELKRSANTLIELLKKVKILNQIMIEINSERSRYSRG